jgi:hypothetical protein
MTTKYSKIKEFLNLLGDNYYVFGGMALSRILKNVQSYDWDIIVDSKYENINSVTQKLRRVFRNIECKPVAFTRSYAGYHTVIHQCGIQGDPEELFDIKFENIGSEPIVTIGGIRYLDIEGLFFNLAESIKDNYELLYDYSLTKRKASNQFINQKIDSQIREIEEWIQEAIEDDDQEAVEEYQEEIDILNSKEYFNKIKEEITGDIEQLESERKKAEKLIEKNSDRIRKLKRAVENPNNFTLKYTNKLIRECQATNNQITKRVGNVVFKCSSLKYN